MLRNARPSPPPPPPPLTPTRTPTLTLIAARTCKAAAARGPGPSPSPLSISVSAARGSSAAAAAEGRGGPGLAPLLVPVPPQVALLCAPAAAAPAAVCGVAGVGVGAGSSCAWGSEVSSGRARARPSMAALQARRAGARIAKWGHGPPRERELNPTRPKDVRVGAGARRGPARGVCACERGGAGAWVTCVRVWLCGGTGGGGRGQLCSRCPFGSRTVIHPVPPWRCSPPAALLPCWLKPPPSTHLPCPPSPSSPAPPPKSRPACTLNGAPMRCAAPLCPPSRPAPRCTPRQHPPPEDGHRHRRGPPARVLLGRSR